MSEQYDALGNYLGGDFSTPAPADVATPQPKQERNLFLDLPSNGPAAEMPVLERPGLWERGKENFSANVNSMTSSLMDHVVARAGTSDQKEERKSARLAEKNVYAAMPDAETAAEYGAAILGGGIGGVVDPLNVLPVPGIAAAAGLGSGVARVGAMAGIGAAYGVGFEGLSQSGDMALGIRQEFAPERLGMAALIGGAFMGGLGGIAEGARAIPRLMDRQLAKEVARGVPDAPQAIPEPVLAAQIAAAVDAPVAARQEPAQARAVEAQMAGPAPKPAPVLDAAETSPLIGAEPTRLPAHSVTTAAGTKIDVAPVVVDAASLRVSSDVGYAPELQPRDRSRAASDAQVRDISANLQPERLGMSAEADRGAPIVGADGMVESGNGRMMAIRQAYAEGGEAATRYRAWVESLGVDTTGMKEPVIVRQRLTELAPEDRQRFTVEANQSATLSMSAPEKALADAGRLTPDALTLIRDPNDMGAAANRDFIKSFAQSLPISERGTFMTADGMVSSEGMARVKNAVLARAYGDNPILARVAESANDDAKSLSGALVAAAPEWAKLKAEIEAGMVRGEVDDTSVLIDAIRQTIDIRARGESLDWFKRQGSFDPPPLEVLAWMEMFYQPGGKRAAGKDIIAERLRYYAQEARKVSADEGLFGDIQPVRAADLRAMAAKKGLKDEQGQTSLFGSGQDRADTNIGARGDAGREQAPSGVGERNEGGGGEGQGTARRPVRQILSDIKEGKPRDDVTVKPEQPVEPQSITQVADDGSIELAAPVGTANLEPGMTPAGIAFRKTDTSSPKGKEPEGPRGIDRGQGNVFRRELPGELRADVDGKGAITTTLAEAMADVSDTLNSAMRKGSVGKALGTANMEQSVIRLRSKGDFVTFMHEAGHIADRTLFEANPEFQVMRANHAAELAAMDVNNEAGSKTVVEGFAEFMRTYGINRGYAEETAPKFFAEFDPWFRANAPDIAATFDKAHDAYQQFIRSAPTEMAKTNIVSHADIKGTRGVWNETEGLPAADRLGAFIRYYANALYGGVVNEWRGIGVVEQRLAKLAELNGKAIPNLSGEMNSPSKLAQMLNGHDVAGMADMKYGVRRAYDTIAEGPTLEDALKSAWGGKLVSREAPEYADFSAYLVAKRSEHLYGLYEQRRIPEPPVGDSWDRVSAAVKLFEERYPTFRDGASKLYEINDLLLKKEFEGGILSSAEYSKIKDSSAFYVPFYRAEEKAAALGSGETVATLQKLTKRYGGDPTAKIIDPIEATVQRSILVNRAIRENQMFNAMAALADAAGPGSGKYFENLPKGTKENDVMGQPYIARFINGEKFFSRFGDDAEGRWVYNSLREMEPGKFDIAMRFIGLFTQTLSRSVTILDPSFFLANMIRDQMTVFTTQRNTGTVGYLPIASWFEGVRHVAKGKLGVDDIERMYAQFGGHRGGPIEAATHEFRKTQTADTFLPAADVTTPVKFTRDMLKRGFDWYTGAIEISETGTRFGIFKKTFDQAKKEGLSDYEAAMRASYEARDIMDFSRSGSAMSVWKGFAPFINPNIQGWDRAIRGLQGDKVEVGKSLARYAILATNHVAYWAAMHDDERYEKASDKIRERYWVLPVPGFLMGEKAPVTYFSIPKPFDLAGLLVNTLEEGLNWWHTNDPHGAKKFAKALIAPVTDLPVQNPIAVAAYGALANHDFFFKKNIVPNGMTKLSPEMQKFSTTDPTYVWIGKQLGMSPLKVQYIARSLTGQTPEKLLDAAAGAVGVEANPGQHVIDNSFARLIGSRFVRSTDKFSQYQIDMLELMSHDAGKASLAAYQYDAARKNGQTAQMNDLWNRATDVEKSVIAIRSSANVVGVQKLIHPLERANAIEGILSGITRELVDKKFEENKPARRKKGDVIEKTPISFAAADGIINLVRDIRNRETYNALAVIGKEGYDVARITPADKMQSLYERVKDHHEGVYEELTRRVTKASIPAFERVQEAWPDVKSRALQDRDGIDVNDLISRKRR